MYRLRISARARKEIKLISRKHQLATIEALQEIKDDPLTGKPLTRELRGKFSYRVGVYRIIYQVSKKDKLITILTAGHRATIYS